MRLFFFLVQFCSILQAGRFGFNIAQSYREKDLRSALTQSLPFIIFYLNLPMCPPETPLSLAVQCEPGVGESIRVLVESGAHIDFRAKDGLTPLHKAVRGHRHTALLVSIHMLSCFYGNTLI